MRISVSMFINFCRMRVFKIFLNKTRVYNTRVLRIFLLNIESYRLDFCCVEIKSLRLEI